MDEKSQFEDIVEFPDSDADKKYKALVGLEGIKDRLQKESEIILDPDLLAEWSKSKHGKIIPLIDLFRDRQSLFIFAGDVGTGKTTLAETFGSELARKKKLNITLFKLSLNSRGSGIVGQMTKLISNAFDEIKKYAGKFQKEGNKYSSVCIMIIDESDALAQSRELDQMHHEDRAGVNALIRGIDSITRSHLPVVIIMCTNRLNAIDPAIRRRAAATFEFGRPNKDMRLQMFKSLLEGTNIVDRDLEKIADLTGENKDRSFGYTYSDITQKILPSVLLHSFPDQPIKFETIEKSIMDNPPTAPFEEYKNEKRKQD